MGTGRVKMPTLGKLVAVMLLAALLAGCAPGTTPAPTPPAASAVPVASAAPPVGTPPTASIVPPPPSTLALTAGLAGLDIDQFFEQSYYQLLRRDPETVTELGLAAALGTNNAQLTDISDGYIRETQALETAILELLRKYDRATLTPEQQLSADIYDWYLDDRVRGQPFVYHDYPVNPSVLGIQYDLQLWFTDLRRLTTKQDAEEYIACLSQVGWKFDQLIAGLKRRQAAGVVLPRFLIPWVLYDLSNIAARPARSTPFYTSFAEKVNALAGLSSADKQALLAAAEHEIAATVIPAYQTLVDYLTQLEAVAPEQPGVWQLPEGQAYYAYLLRHYTTTDLTAEEIHQLGLQELERIHAEMRALFDQLGYPQDEDLTTLYGRVAQDGGVLYGEEIVARYETIIADAEERTAAAFDLRPKAEVIVIPGPTGGYYVAPALDGSRPGAFYAAYSGTEYRFAMPSLAYHEAVPGHHYQIALAQELDLPAFRRNADFTGYIEGWALYAERLAWELGLYEGDPYGNLGRLQMEAWRAARLVVDTGIHSKRWTFDQAVDFLVENTGRRREGMESEAARYVVWPGQATAYYIGYMKILELRQRAQEALGERFDFKEFHNVILGSGAVPLDMLERIVEEYIATRQ